MYHWIGTILKVVEDIGYVYSCCSIPVSSNHSFSGGEVKMIRNINPIL